MAACQRVRSVRTAAANRGAASGTGARETREAVVVDGRAPPLLHYGSPELGAPPKTHSPIPPSLILGGDGLGVEDDARGT